MVGVVFSVRIPKRLERLMDECSGVDWGEEVKAFIHRRVRELLLTKYLGIAREARKQLDRILAGVDKLIREDREHEY